MSFKPLTMAGEQFAKALICPLFQYEEEAAAMLDERAMETAIAMQNKFADSSWQHLMQYPALLSYIIYRRKQFL